MSGGAEHRRPRAEAEVPARVLPGPASAEVRVAARVVGAADRRVSPGLVQQNAGHPRVARFGIKSHASGGFIMENIFYSGA